jgi:hypothetical protein
MTADALKTDYKGKSEEGSPSNGPSKNSDVVDLNDPNSMNTLLLMAGGKR